MATAIAHEPVEPPTLHYRFTVDAYHRMLANGTLEDGAPFELLDGQVVRKIRSAVGEDPMTINPRHVLVVAELGDLNPKLKKAGCYMRVQSPLSLPPFNEAEPDAASVRGGKTDYAEHHPAADDVVCVIEVSDASLRVDRGRKQRIYASAGIAAYIIANLQDDVVEFYTEPLPAKGRYARMTTLSPKETFAIPTAKGKPLSVPVKRLLP